MPAAPSKPDAAPGPLSVKVTLRDVRPAIWRRLVVPRTMTLGRLHDAIQATMGWTHSHLHAFTVADRRYGDPAQQLEGTANENNIRLDRLVKSGINRFEYIYDFGDGWEHDLLIEKRVPKADGLALPTCVAGERRCPPEDCGGVWGYADLLDILADPENPERAERLEWIGDVTFDPEAFDLKAANRALAVAFARGGVWMKV